MRKFLICLKNLIFLSLFITSADAYSQVETPKDFSHLTVMITTHVGEIGAGIVIGEDADWTYIITARHVIVAPLSGPSEHIEVKLFDNPDVSVVALTYEAIPENIASKLDLAVLKIKKSKKVFPTYERVLDKEIPDKLSAIGRLGVNANWKQTPSFTVHADGNYPNHFIIESFFQLAGFSGGPAVDVDGRLAGMIVAGGAPTQAGEGTGALALKASIILSVLREHGVPVFDQIRGPQYTVIPQRFANDIPRLSLLLNDFSFGKHIHLTLNTFKAVKLESITAEFFVKVDKAWMNWPEDSAKNEKQEKSRWVNAFDSSIYEDQAASVREYATGWKRMQTSFFVPSKASEFIACVTGPITDTHNSLQFFQRRVDDEYIQSSGRTGDQIYNDLYLDDLSDNLFIVDANLTCEYFFALKTEGVVKALSTEYRKYPKVGHLLTDWQSSFGLSSISFKTPLTFKVLTNRKAELPNSSDFELGIDYAYGDFTGDATSNIHVNVTDHAGREWNFISVHNQLRNQKFKHLRENKPYLRGAFKNIDPKGNLAGIMPSKIKSVKACGITKTDDEVFIVFETEFEKDESKTRGTVEWQEIAVFKPKTTSSRIEFLKSDNPSTLCFDGEFLDNVKIGAYQGTLN